MSPKIAGFLSGMLKKHKGKFALAGGAILVGAITIAVIFFLSLYKIVHFVTLIQDNFLYKQLVPILTQQFAEAYPDKVDRAVASKYGIIQTARAQGNTISEAELDAKIKKALRQKIVDNVNDTITVGKGDSGSNIIENYKDLASFKLDFWSKAKDLKEVGKNETPTALDKGTLIAKTGVFISKSVESTLDEVINFIKNIWDAIKDWLFDQLGLSNTRNMQWFITADKIKRGELSSTIIGKMTTTYWNDVETSGKYKTLVKAQKNPSLLDRIYVFQGEIKSTYWAVAQSKDSPKGPDLFDEMSDMGTSIASKVGNEIGVNTSTGTADTNKVRKEFFDPLVNNDEGYNDYVEPYDRGEKEEEEEMCPQGYAFPIEHSKISYSDSFGDDRSYGTGSGNPHSHGGTDLMHKKDEKVKVYAITDGVIRKSKTFSDGAKLWIESTNAETKGYGYYYTHLHDIVSGISDGVMVTAGQLIAHSGGYNAGADGDHLHFGVASSVNGKLVELPRLDHDLHGQTEYKWPDGEITFNPYPILKKLEKDCKSVWGGSIDTVTQLGNVRLPGGKANLSVVAGKLGHEDHLHKNQDTGRSCLLTGETSYIGSDSNPLRQEGSCGPWGDGQMKRDQERWYFNMQWKYNGYKNEYHHKKIILTNPANKKRIVVSIEEWGPALWVTPKNGVNSGAPPEVHNYLFGKINHGGTITIGIAKDQNIPLGPLK